MPTIIPLAEHYHMGFQTLSRTDVESLMRDFIKVYSRPKSKYDKQNQTKIKISDDWRIEHLRNVNKRYISHSVLNFVLLSTLFTVCAKHQISIAPIVRKSVGDPSLNKSFNQSKREFNEWEGVSRFLGVQLNPSLIPKGELEQVARQALGITRHADNLLGESRQVKQLMQAFKGIECAKGLHYLHLAPNRCTGCKSTLDDKKPGKSSLKKIKSSGVWLPHKDNWVLKIAEQLFPVENTNLIIVVSRKNAKTGKTHSIEFDPHKTCQQEVTLDLTTLPQDGRPFFESADLMTKCSNAKNLQVFYQGKRLFCWSHDNFPTADAFMSTLAQGIFKSLVKSARDLGTLRDNIHHFSQTMNPGTGESPAVKILADIVKNKGLREKILRGKKTLGEIGFPHHRLLNLRVNELIRAQDMAWLPSLELAKKQARIAVNQDNLFTITDEIPEQVRHLLPKKPWGSQSIPKSIEFVPELDEPVGSIEFISAPISQGSVGLLKHKP